MEAQTQTDYGFCKLMTVYGSQNKTLNDQLKKEVQSIEDQWKSDKPTDKDKKPNENEEKDYNDSVEKDFHPEV